MKKFISVFILTVLVFCLSARLISAQQTAAKDAPALQLQQKIEKTIAGGENHAYKVRADANQLISAVVEQRGIDLLVAFFAPDGKKLAEVDSPNGTNGPEPLLIIVEAAGEYRVEVTSLDKNAPAGAYEISLQQQRAATETDKKRVRAEKLFAEATLLYGQSQAEGYRQAIVKYLEAVPILRELEDFDRAAAALQAIGACYFTLGNIEEARKFYQQTLDLRRQIKDARGEAEALNNLANVFSITGDKKRAAEYLEQALKLIREAGDRATEGALMSNLGQVYSEIAEDRKAIEYFNQSLPILRASGNRYAEVYTLVNMGNSHIDLSEPQAALENFQQALAVARSMGERNAESMALAGMGNAYVVLGEPLKAIEFNSQSLELARTTGNRLSQANALINIADGYFALGNWQKTLEFAGQAAALFNALKITQSEGYAQKTVGLALSSLNEHEKAAAAFDKALALSRSIKDKWGEAFTLGGYGQIYENKKDFARAREYFTQSAEILRTIDAKRNVAVMLLAIANAERELGNLEAAQKNLEEALAINEALRGSILSRELRSSYRGATQRFQELYIDILMNLSKRQPGANNDYAVRAFEASERSRARALLELLAESRADLGESIAPELAGREREQRQKLNEKASQMTLLPKTTANAAKIAELRKEIDLLSAQYEQTEAAIRKANPRFAALVQPEAVSLGKIQKELLDKDTILLEYALGERGSFLWLVTNDSFKSFELPKRGVIEEQARKVYQALKTPAAADDNTETAKLSEMILSPVAAELGSKRILVVADGALQYVPFASLTVRGSSKPRSLIVSGKTTPQQTTNNEPRTTNNEQFLIESNEIISLPSISVLAEMRREKVRKSALKTLAVFADPVFSAADPRAKSVKQTGASKDAKTDAGGNVLRDFFGNEAGGSDGGNIPRLPFSRREAEAILQNVPANQSLKAVDFAANARAATGGELSNYKIVHFATHGLLNSKNPELSGLVLSLVDEKGEPTNGFLRLNDIYNLRLNADLVVLSACQTALGRDIKGEGLIGLTRGFMYAGSPRVVASLWKVDDAATAELMKLFYGNLLNKKLRPAEALRAAQMEMSQSERFKSPYFWAAFTLQGEWK